MKYFKKIVLLMLAVFFTFSSLTACNKDYGKKFAKVDEADRNKKREKSLENLKNRKDIMLTENAALTTTDYENLNGFEAVTIDGKEYSQKDLEKKDMTIVYIWYSS